MALVTGAAAQGAITTIDSRFAEVNGIKLHYLIAGKGPPVLLLHGYGQNSHMWRPLMAELAKTHTVIAPDLRGFGQSDKPESGYDKPNMAQDVHALCASLGHMRVGVVGHDIGLMVAYAYAAQYPTEVDRIVLMDAFLPGVGDWTGVWLLRDLWHFHFYGKTPLVLVEGRERIYFEHFWNDSQPIPHARFPRLIGSFMRQPMRSPVPCGQASRCFAPSSRTPSTSPASQGSN
jgi:pimeloyl-ACP methyl ester carboxylesterase